MEICGHCHNVLSKTVDRCTVCGTERVDPSAADVRRRSDGDLPAHAPGWAAPSVKNAGIHPDDFLRELAGESNGTAGATQHSGAFGATDLGPADFGATNLGPADFGALDSSVDESIAPVLPPRSVPATPAPGALAGYLGTTVDRSQSDTIPPTHPTTGTPTDPNSPIPPPSAPVETPQPAMFAQHLSTATNVAPDGVAARTTRLDGTVKLGPTNIHRLLTLSAPLMAGLLLISGALGSYRIRTSQAEEVEAAAAEPLIDTSAVSQSSSAVVRLDLDGCGVIGQTTGFLFADQTILVPQSLIVTDNRPTALLSDGTSLATEIVGWSLVRDLAILRADERRSGGLRWGVSSRVSEGDIVSVLAINGPGVVAPVPATIETANTVNGRNTSFELDVNAAAGSVVLNAEGFVIGVIDSHRLAQASDDVAPAMSRVVLANDRPQAVCPRPQSTVPVESDSETTNETNGTEELTPDK